MIVISGALVLVALVLLVLGLTMQDLDFVYGSIGVSLVSFVFLVIGILQRRGQPAAAGGPPVADDAALDETPDAAPARRAATGPRVPSGGSVAVRKQDAQDDSAGDDDADDRDGDDDAGHDVGDEDRPHRSAAAGAATGQDDDDELEPGGGPVLVVQGRPRYHVEGCRYLEGKQAEEIDVLDAQDDGYVACGVCKPDEVLEELYGPLVYEDEDEDDAPAPAPATPSGSAASAGSTEPRGSVPAGGSTSAEPRPEPLSQGAPAGDAPDGDVVVVVQGRGRFHTADCRFLRGMPTEELSRDAADEQGYRPCGVCKP